ncbi:hypothetical protein J3A83DRAFT_4241062 [Scleroderma citrinum]
MRSMLVNFALGLAPWTYLAMRVIDPGPNTVNYTPADTEHLRRHSIRSFSRSINCDVPRPVAQDRKVQLCLRGAGRIIRF